MELSEQGALRRGQRPGVLHVSEVVGGGVWTVLFTVCAAVDPARWNSELVVIGRPDDVGDDIPASTRPDFRVDKLSAGHSRFSGLVGLAARARAALRTGELVHCHSTVAGAIVRPLAVLMGRRSQVIYSPHGYAFLDPSRPRRFRIAIRGLERMLARACALTIAVSMSEADVARSLGAKCVQVIRNGVDLAGLPVAERDGQPLFVVAAGRWAVQKRPWIFAEVAADVAPRTGARFVWMGADPSPTDPWLGGATITTIPWVTRDEALKLVSEAALFAMPSGFEGLPMALIEAQAMGVPAVVMNVPGCRDAVVDGVTGVVCNSVDEFSAAVSRLLDDEKERARLAQNALDRRHEWDVRLSIHAYEAAYEAVRTGFVGRV